jgi:hypothetical protein
MSAMQIDGLLKNFETVEEFDTEKEAGLFGGTLERVLREANTPRAVELRKLPDGRWAVGHPLKAA